MKSTESPRSIGTGILIFLIFLTLKLAGIGIVATWSWWWVTSPLWIPIVVLIIFCGIIATIGAFLR